MACHDDGGDATSHGGHEPSIGALFGNFYYRDPGIGAAHPHQRVIHLGEAQRGLGFLSSAPSSSMRQARCCGETDALIVREAYGSIGAPLLMEALPESRMVLLMLDPRDVVASNLDAFRPASSGSSALSTNRIPSYGAENVSALSTDRVNAREA